MTCFSVLEIMTVWAKEDDGGLCWVPINRFLGMQKKLNKKSGLDRKFRES